MPNIDTPLWREQYQIVSPEQPLAQESVALFESISRRLLGEKYTQGAIQFYYSTSLTKSAHIYPQSNPPIMVITKQTLMTAQNVDQLAGVIAHELGHHKLHERFGYIPSGKAQEVGADLIAVDMLDQAGYRRDGLSKYFENSVTYVEQNPNLAHILEEVFDGEHPDTKLRIQTLQGKEKVIARTGNGDQIDPHTGRPLENTPFDSKWYSQAKQHYQPSFVERLLSERNYAQADTSGKLGILSDILKNEVPKWRAADTENFKHLTRAMNTGLPQAIPPESQFALRQFVDAAVIPPPNATAPVWFKGLKDAHKSILRMDGGYLPAGLADYYRALQTFKEATSATEAQSSAESVLRYAKKYELLTAYNGGIYPPSFNLPERNAVELSSPDNPLRPSWDNHAQWAVEKSSTDIAQTLHLFGIGSDPRVESLLGARPKFAPLTTAHSTDTSWKDRYTMLKIVQDSSGGITGFQFERNTTGTVQSVFRERQRRAELYNQAEAEALRSVNWSEVTQDFDGFVKKYRDVLTPPLTTYAKYTGYDTPRDIPAGASLNTNFISEFIQRAKSNPNTEKRLLEFLSPQNSGEAKPYNVWNESRKEQGSDYKFGLSPDHPYARYILTADPEKISAFDKIRYLDVIKYLSDDVKSSDRPIAQKMLVDPAIILRGVPGLPIRSLDDITRFSRAVNEHIAYSTDAVVPYDLYAKATLGFIQSFDRPLTPEEIARIADNTGASGVMGNVFDGQLNDALKASVTKYFDHYKSSSVPIGEMVDNYLVLSANHLLTAAQQKEIERALAEQLRGLKKQWDKASSTERTALVSEIDDISSRLAIRHNYGWSETVDGQTTHHSTFSPYDGDLNNPVLRSVVLDLVTDVMAHRMGKDDGSRDYTQKVKNIFEYQDPNSIARFNKSTYLELVDKLAHKIHAQHESSYILRDKVLGNGFESALRAPLTSSIGEAGLHVMAHSEATREATKKFLMQPFSENSAIEFYNALQEEVNKNDGADSLDRRQQELAYKFMDAFPDGLDTPWMRREVLSKLHDAHANIYHAPLTARTALLQPLFFPSHEFDSPDLLEHNKQVALDTTFPLHGVSEKLVKQNNFARQVVSDYFDSLPDIPKGSKAAEQRLLVTAVMAAKMTSNVESGQYRPGRALRQVLDFMVPAGPKMAQAIDSYLNTKTDPDLLELKEDMADAKTQAAPPYRWQLFEWMEKYNLIPPLEQKRVNGTDVYTYPKGEKKPPHVGEIKGSGSYGVTFAMTPDGEETRARTLLRPHAKEQAAREFGILREAAQKFVARNPQFKPLLQMVEQAEHSSVIETDMAKAALQNTIAQRTYDGLQITADGRTFTFSTAPWIEHGQYHKDTSIIPGEHFNDLKTDTPESAAYKQAAAKALLTAELYTLMRGEHFDHDRHGGQQRIKGNNVGLFDFGGMSLESMTQHQKQLLGAVVGDVFKQAGISQAKAAAASSLGLTVNETNLSQSFTEAINKYAASAADKQFLATVERGVLALGDYAKALPPDAVKSAFMDVLKTGHVDPAIMRQMRHSMGDMVWQRFEQQLAEHKPAVELTHPHPPDLNAPQNFKPLEASRSWSAADANYRGGRIAARFGGAMAVMDLYNGRIGKVQKAIQAGDYGKALHETNVGGLALGAAAADVWSLMRVSGAQIAGKASLPLAVGYGLYEGMMGLSENNQKRAMDGFGGTGGAIVFGMAAAKVLQHSRLGPWGVATGLLGAGIYGFSQGSSLANNAAILFTDKEGKALTGSQMYKQLNAFMDDANLTYQEDPTAYRFSVLGVGVVPKDSYMPGKVFKVNGNPDIDGTKYPAAYALYQQLNRSLQDGGMKAPEAEAKALSLLRTETYQRLLEDADPFLYNRPYNPLESSALTQHMGKDALALQQMLKENAIGLHAASKMKTAYPVHAYAMLNNIHRLAADGSGKPVPPIATLFRDRHKALFDGISVDDEGKVTFSGEATEQKLSAFLDDAKALITKGELTLTDRERASLTTASFDSAEENKMYETLIGRLRVKGIQMNDSVALQILQAGSILARKGNALDGKQHPDDAAQLLKTVTSLEHSIMRSGQTAGVIDGMKALEKLRTEQTSEGRGTFGAPTKRKAAIEEERAAPLDGQMVIKNAQATGVKIEGASGDEEPKGAKELAARKDQKDETQQRA
ncbi:MAG: hypothetical protein MRY32_01115 [Rickettsiales bacterium]|nr:hypothetical protein [Rickettsiales bacterium]